ncbi:ROK family glucokinase [Ornithinimicrobium pekingense]|uniref:Glucokinase n=1 Tax=Ornithinimicrobium pekingense TaxID=384677 RepID=A0ABQ2FAC3_9MICO|nr:ROK family glucokinase [Ornithinimicrobium pekingense]GGK69386.1 glucokinase [Ornithinimicrobium pekingense]
MSAGALSVGVDVGGTRIKAGLVDDRGRVVHATRHDTPDRTTLPRVVEDAVVGAVTELMARPEAQERGVVGVGIGAAGFVAADRGTVVFAPHLSWRDEPLQEKVSARLGVHVVVDNDANAAAWAEHRFGAARGESHLLLVTLGTGIGGAVLVDGELQRGRHGLAGEFGHMTVVPEGRRCECGNRGCWEQYASGAVLRRDALELLDAGSTFATALLRRCDGRPELIEGEDVTRAAREGDPVAVELVAEVGRWLGVGLANLVAALDPGTVVVGGGASEAGDLLLAPAREALARHLAGRGHRPVPQVRAAALGVGAGLVGAADLARRG